MESKKVEIEDGKWKCEKDKQFQNVLNLRYTPDILFYSRFYDYDLAELAIKEWGGRIVKIINPPKFVKDKVY